MADPRSRPSLLPRAFGFAFGVTLFVALLFVPPPPGMPADAWRVTALVGLMAAWWFFEAVPIAVTALLPLVLLPALDVAPIAEAARPYSNPLVFLLLGGFMIGLAMQRCDLHLRIALLIMRLAGARPEMIVAGFMLATAGLSMWISNTATTAMMVPIGLSVIALVADRDPGPAAPGGGVANLPLVLLLSIAFAANIGGMGTLIGTPPNAVLAGFMGESYGRDIGFAQWMVLGVPVAAVLLMLAWLVLTRVAYPVRGADMSGVGVLIRRERVRLGAMSAAEKRFSAVFALTVLAWLFRPVLDRALPGIGLSDAGIAVAAAILLFIIPANLKEGRFLMDWSATRDLPWGVLILIGGGLSLGTAIETSGLAAWVGEALVGGLRHWPLPAIVAVVAVAAMLASHVTSNTATAAALVPVAAGLAISLGEGPVALAAPLVLAASCAFMLPVATPPNAIVHGTGRVATVDMLRAGALVSAVAIVVIVAAGLLIAAPLFATH